MKYVTEEFYIPEAQISRWEYFKGSKKEKRVRADGFEYFYTEGGMAFPDSLDSPSRKQAAATATTVRMFLPILY